MKKQKVSKELIISILVWNIIAFLYHSFFIGMYSSTSVIIQITALIMEWLLCGVYENYLIKLDNKTNNIKEKKTRYISKYIIFTLLFGLIYGVGYFVRLEFFYLINYGITEAQISKSMINMSILTVIMGAAMGWVLLSRIKKVSDV